MAVTDRAGTQSGATWTTQGAIVFGRGDTLWRVARSGGAAQQLIKLDSAQEESRAYLPNALPGGSRILFAVTSKDRSRIDALDMATGERQVVIESGSFPLYTSAGYLVFVRDGRVLAVPFDATNLKVTGPAVQLLDNVPNLASGAPLFDLSVSGTFIYSPTTAVSRLVWVSRHGDEQALNDVRRNYTNPRISPDGQRILVQAGDLWMQDLLRGTFSRLTNGDSLYNAFPRWLSDTRVVYRSANGLRAQGTNGPNDGAQLLAGTTELDYPGPLAADGDTMLVGRSTETTSFDVVALSLRDPSKLSPILQSPAYESGQWLSPDRRWMTYVSNESGRNEIYLMPYPGPGGRLQVSTEGGTQAVWSRDGKEIFYRTADRMMGVEVATSPVPRLSTPKLLFESRYAYGAGITIANFDVAADGRFVMVKPESGTERLNVVLNWFAERGAAATAH
jgi:Tol biopolymer transport system component